MKYKIYQENEEWRVEVILQVKEKDGKVIDKGSFALSFESLCRMIEELKSVRDRIMDEQIDKSLKSMPEKTYESKPSLH